METTTQVVGSEPEGFSSKGLGILVDSRRAYCSELQNEIGICFLKLSVLAGMELQDGVSYSPQGKFIGVNRASVLSQLRQLFSEIRDLSEFANLRNIFADPSMDPLPLAISASNAVPHSFDARLNLGANFLRKQMVQDANRELSYLEKSVSERRGDSRERVYRNLSCLWEQKEDLEGAIFYAKRAFQVSPANLPTVINYLVYSALSGGVSAIRQVKRALIRSNLGTWNNRGFIPSLGAIAPGLMETFSVDSDEFFELGKAI